MAAATFHEVSHNSAQVLEVITHVVCPTITQLLSHFVPKITLKLHLHTFTRFCIFSYNTFFHFNHNTLTLLVGWMMSRIKMCGVSSWEGREGGKEVVGLTFVLFKNPMGERTSAFK